MAEKKETTKRKKSSTRKKEVKEKKIIEEAKALDSPKKAWKDIFSSVPFLFGVLCFLLVFIIFLGFLIYHKEKEKEESFDAHISIPVLKIGSSFKFGIDASLLLEEKDQEYIFKVTNYRNDVKAKIDIPYKVIINNPTNAVISLTKEEDKTDLMVEQNNTELEEIMPFSEENEAVYFHIKITSHDKMKSDDFISVEIVS